MKSVLWCLLTAVVASSAAAAEPHRLTLQVHEPVGVHRDGSPVHVLLELPQPVDAATRFRLLDQGQPIVAQFRPGASGDQTASWWLDFVARCTPHGSRRYVVEYGPDLEPGPQRSGGHKLTETDDTFVISNAPYIDWTVPRDLRGFLRSVDFPPSEHLRPDSVGLTLRDREGGSHPLGGAGTRAEVVRQGRMAVALRFEKTETDEALRGVHWRVDLLFPGPVSWVDMRLNIEDPQNRVEAAGLQLRLNLNPPTGATRTLVELGAARTVYRSLLGNQQVELRADQRQSSPWQVLRGDGRQLQPFVVSPPRSAAAEGWAHIMDRKRCLAVAFDRFGQQGEERLNVRADGTLTAVKKFIGAAPDGTAPPKAWRAWLHFVHFPPQQSAGTDPYMMQHPLVVRELDR